MTAATQPGVSPCSTSAAYEVWFVTGSQHLYGPETLEHGRRARRRRSRRRSTRAPAIPVRVVVKPVLTGLGRDPARCARRPTPTPRCVGLITWMHTFSPAKMWIAGLDALQKPFLHLHTQYNREIPWADIDMDFMNLNQAAHGDREFGFIAARLRLERKVVVGHWADAEVQERIGAWARAACARHDWETGRIARFGDNMREVAVTEGDKVEAQRRLGFSVNSYGVGDLVARRRRGVRRRRRRAHRRPTSTSTTSTPALRPGGDRRGVRCATARGSSSACGASSRTAAFIAFTDTFEDLHGLTQLPGLAVQRLMADGYGFGAEGDWKTAAMVRAMKVMAAGLPGGVSFMEDYTYHLDRRAATSVLGAHMLEVCQSIAGGAAAARGPPAVDRRQGRPGPARVRRPSRAGGRRLRSPTWASASGWSRPSSTSSRPSSRCRSCRSPARCGVRGPTSRRTRPPGSTPAARTTRASATR